MSRIAILGAGSWGTALAIHAARRGHAVSLLFRDAGAAAAADRRRENEPYLPGQTLPAEVQPTADPAVALEGAAMALVVTPVKGLELAAEWLRRGPPAEMPVVSCAKGIRVEDLETPAVFLARRLPSRAGQIAVLSGPTFALELAQGHPTAAVVAAHDAAVARGVQRALTGGALRLYANSDPVGVELAAAVKNVMAVAAGVVDGLGYGTNTRAALITRGLSEATRLAVACGGSAATLAGLAGLGDLVLTCTGSLSRNRSVGRQLGEGRSLEEITATMNMVAEGVSTTQAALALARRHDVEMPLVEQMAAVLFEGKRPADAVASLLARALKDEETFNSSPPRV